MTLDSFAMPDLPPEAILLTAPVGGGKTEAALDDILTTRLLRGFAPIWVLMASGQQIQEAQTRLVQRSEDQVQFGVEFFNVDDLYLRVLELLGDPQRRVRETARFRILRYVIDDLMAQGALTHYHTIAHTPGFIGLVAGLIHELKQGLVEPDAFAQVAATRAAKDRDLALIYAGYQTFLQSKQLVDRHGAGWLAVRHLENGQKLPEHARPALLVIDGFDQFNVVSRRLITALARQIERTVLTLTAVPSVPGRRFRRFEITHDQLLALGGDLWQVQTVPAPDPLLAPGAARQPVLAHLVDQLFRSAPQTIPGDDALHLIEAPDRPREVAAALRHVKRLLLAGAPPDAIAVIIRDMDRYAGLLRETARAYGLPLVVRTGLQLRENPAIAALLNLLDLADRDFPRREVLDTLHSPYLKPPDLTTDQIAQLERVSRHAQIVRGGAVWLEAIAAAGQPRRTEDGEVDALLEADDADALTAALANHFARITPPELAPVDEFVDWIADLFLPDPAALAEDTAEMIAATPDDEPGSAADMDPFGDAPSAEVAADMLPGDAESAPGDPVAAGQPDAAAGEAQPDAFNVLDCIRRATDPVRIARDVRALGVFRNVLFGIRSAHDLLAGDQEPPAIPWVEFRAELELAIKRATVMPSGGLNRLGRVLATSVLEARGLPHEHVIVLGLAEGIFPQQEADDALYSETDRLELEQATPRIDMLTYTERADDMSLFYQAVGLARRSLTLTRFTVDEKGTEVPPSPYWNAVRAVVDVPTHQITRLPVGAAPTLSDAATHAEALVALAAALSGERLDAYDPERYPLAGVHAALRDDPAWQNAQHGRALEARREDRAYPIDHYFGLLRDEHLIAIAAELLGPRRSWSATQFNEYGTCPYRFFARRLLRLEELEEPEEGPDILQTGSLNHKILEEAYTRIAAENLAIAPENQERALAILDEVAAELFPTAPEVFGFRASPVWVHEQRDLHRRLAWLVELDFSAGHPFQLGPRQQPAKHPVAAQITDQVRYPHQQEAAFGLNRQPPLVIEGPAGPLKVRGKIDRMDRVGDRLVIIDYKTGTSPRRVEDMDAGREFQMAIYLLAALDRQRTHAADHHLTIAGGVFWHIRNRAISGEVDAADPAVEHAREWMHAHVLNARAGLFPVTPSDPSRGACASYCEFKSLCRYGRAYRGKRLPDYLHNEGDDAS